MSRKPRPLPENESLVNNNVRIVTNPSRPLVWTIQTDSGSSSVSTERLERDGEVLKICNSTCNNTERSERSPRFSYSSNSIGWEIVRGDDIPSQGQNNAGTLCEPESAEQRQISRVNSGTYVSSSAARSVRHQFFKEPPHDECEEDSILRQGKKRIDWPQQESQMRVEQAWDSDNSNHGQFRKIDLFSIPQEPVARVLSDAIECETTHPSNGSQFLPSQYSVPKTIAQPAYSDKHRFEKRERSIQNRDEKEFESLQQSCLNEKPKEPFGFNVGSRVYVNHPDGEYDLGVIRRIAIKKVYSLLYEDGDREKLVLASEKFFIVGNAIKRLSLKGEVENEVTTQIRIPWARSYGRFGIQQDTYTKLEGSEKISELVQPGDCIFVYWHLEKKYFGATVTHDGRELCYYIDFQQTRNLWIREKNVVVCEGMKST